MNTIEKNQEALESQAAGREAMKLHELTIQRNMAGLGWDGYCGCSDYGYEDGWTGGVFFLGATPSEVRDQHFDHVLESANE